MKWLLIICMMLAGWQTKSQEATHYFLFLESNPGRPELPPAQVDSLQQAHLENIGKLAREGKLVVAGPFEGGGGIFILNTGNFEEAEKWVQTDPAVQAGRFKLELLPWKTRVGKPCLASPDAEMAKFSFIRYEPHQTKFNIRQAPLLFKAHDDYMKKVLEAHDVVTEGLFVPNDGGVLIVEGEPDRELIMNDPAVRDGILYPVFREIWLSRGSFCEQ